MIKTGDFTLGGGNPLVLIAGPCVIENRDLVLKTADRLTKISRQNKIPLIFKSSYKKANRTSGKSFSGIGIDLALKILSDVHDEFGLPILTDIHSEYEAELVAQVADILQIPAFLCRQTDILYAAGRTGKVVNIKKGQFMAPEDMKLQAEKVTAVGNKKVMLTERGASFGYHNLVVDMRSLVIMKKFGYPVVLDATHSVQLPGGDRGVTGGQPEFIFPIARAGVAVGIDALFIETHPDPKHALSDSKSQLPLNHVDQLLKEIIPIDKIVKENIEKKK